MTYNQLKVRTEWGKVYRKRVHFYISIDGVWEERLNPKDPVDKSLIDVYLDKLAEITLRELAKEIANER